MTKVYQRTGSLPISRSMFNLSYSKTMTCDMGQLIPVLCDEVVPGDIFEVGSEAVIRFQPLVAPILHEVNVYLHLYFVPYRLLWPKNDAETDGWEPFITGGVNGTTAPTLPTWTPSGTSAVAVGSLWDYIGFPTGLTVASMTGPFPSDFPRRAYNFIFNEYYRDQTLQTKVALTNENILLRNWEKDYFTSALPWQQRGSAPALPISGTTHAVWPAYSTGLVSNMVQDQNNNHPGSAATLATLNNNTIDLSSATTFNISDFRLATQVQKWLERNARGGARYTEFLKQHFAGISPRDERLQRPEYIGGSKAPVIVSEVLQTSKTDTSPQGNMAGHALSVQHQFAGKYHAQEYGLIMGIMSVIPRTIYSQGINRQWLRKTKYDFYFREFANLSEQQITQSELYYKELLADNNTVFGYQGRYNEMRSKDNMFCGQMRSTYAYWHLGRTFSSAPALNETFIQCSPRKDIFAAPSQPGLIVSWGNKIKALRPLPVEPVPGLTDHF